MTDTSKPSDDDPSAAPPVDPQIERQSWEATRAALHRADLARNKLWDSSRVPLDDRPILARNLGRMIERTHQDRPKNLQVLFCRAFDDDRIGESHLKKRKRFVRFSGELATDGTRLRTSDFVAEGRAHVRLAEALATDAPRTPDEGRQDAKRLQILRLIEGTSFDNRVDTYERQRSDAREELLKRLEQMVDSIERRVDLHQMRAHAQSHPLGVPPVWPKRGTLSLVDERGWGHTLDLGGDLSGPIRSRLAPAIHLADLFSKVRAWEVVLLQVADAAVRQLGTTKAVAAEFFRSCGLPEDFDGEDWPSSMDYARGSVWHPRLIGVEAVPADERLHLWLRQRLDLQLRFDPLSEKWRPCFCLAPEAVLGMVEADCYYFGYDTRPLDVSEPIASSPASCYFAARSAKGFYIVTSTTFFDLDELEDALSFDHFGGLPAVLVALPSEKSFGLAFTPLASPQHSVAFKIEHLPGRFSLAPHDTIAGAILRNLAYAPPEQQVGHLLLEDARARALGIDEFFAAERAKYTGGIEKLQADDVTET